MSGTYRTGARRGRSLAVVGVVLRRLGLLVPGLLVLGVLVVGTEAGDHVAQRRQLADDRVAPLGHLGDVGLDQRELALALGVTVGAQGVRLLLRRAHHLLRL